MIPVSSLTVVLVGPYRPPLPCDSREPSTTNHADDEVSRPCPLPLY